MAQPGTAPGTSQITAQETTPTISAEAAECYCCLLRYQRICSLKRIAPSWQQQLQRSIISFAAALNLSAFQANCP